MSTEYRLVKMICGADKPILVLIQRDAAGELRRAEVTHGESEREN